MERVNAKFHTDTLKQRIGEAKALKKMLVLKFGSRPNWAERQIAQADAALLDQWIENLLDAENLETIFK